jgi:hypothetical protein
VEDYRLGSLKRVIMYARMRANVLDCAHFLLMARDVEAEGKGRRSIL